MSLFPRRLANAAAMCLFDIWVPILFIALIAPRSLGYPSETRPLTLALTSPEASSQVNLTGQVQAYPHYPTRCLPPSSRGRVPRPSDLPNVLSDCTWIINDLLRQDSLLFQDLVFYNHHFEDQHRKRRPSRWYVGQCSINVSSMNRQETQTLHLFNVVLAANKILKECIEDQGNPLGGTVSIGSPDKAFFVSVLGYEGSPAISKSYVSSLSRPDVSRRDSQGSRLRTTSSIKSSTGGYDANDMTVSLPPDISIGKRDSGPQPESSPSRGTKSLKLNLLVPSNDISGNIITVPKRPVVCFNPYSVELKSTAADDCRVIIDEIILRYPNPMSPQSFGYTPSADIDLSLPENKSWVFGYCMIFVLNTNKTRTDTFKMVDVAATAQHIVTQCVIDAKYAVGGTAGIGTAAEGFYVGLGAPSGPVKTTYSSRLRNLSSVDLVHDRIGTHRTLELSP